MCAAVFSMCVAVFCSDILECSTQCVCVFHFVYLSLSLCLLSLSLSTLGETQLVRPHEKLPGITWVSNPATRKDLAARTWGVFWY